MSLLRAVSALAAVVLCLRLDAAVAAGKDSKGHKVGKHVSKMKEEKFSHFLKQPDRQDLLVEFFAPWCGACKQFAPTYARTGEMAKERGMALKVAAVDTDAERKLASQYNIEQFPTIMFFPKHTKSHIKHQGIPNSAEALLAWVADHSGAAITKVETEDMVPPPELGQKPIAVIHAAVVPEDLVALSEAARQDAQWFHVVSFTTDVRVEMRHHGQDPVGQDWPQAKPDDDDDAKKKAKAEFIKFFLLHRYPRFIPVHEPHKFTKQMSEDNRDNFGLIYVLLNTTGLGGDEIEGDTAGADDAAACSAAGPAAAKSGESGGGGSCSAGGAPSGKTAGRSSPTSEAAKRALEEAARPWRRSFTTAAKVLNSKTDSGLKTSFRVAYMDGSRHAAWAEHKLYAWNFPMVIVQKMVGVGSMYVFGDSNKTMPENAQELISFVRDTDLSFNATVRRKSQKPFPEEEEDGKPFKRVVHDNMEELLRSTPGSVLYVYKGPDQMSGSSRDEEEALVHEDEMEALSDLSNFLQKNCETPPAVFALDARLNDIPMSLYAKADFGLLSLPGLFFIPNDYKKTGLGGYWGKDIQKFEPPTVDDDDEEQDDTSDPKKKETDKALKSLRSPLRVLSSDLATAAKWVLLEAMNVPGLKVPGDGTVFPADALGQASQGPAVYTVDEQSFVEFTRQFPTAMVEFYAPWCGHCKKFAPTYEAAARSCRREGGLLGTIGFAKIDGTNARGLVKKYNIDSYPTLLFLFNGTLHPYTGGQKKKDVLSWLEVEVNPAVRPADAASVQDSPGVFLNGKQDEKTMEVFQEVAEHYKHSMRFYYVEDAAKNARKLVLRLPSKTQAAYSGAFTSDNIIWWLASETVKSEPVPPESEQRGVVRKVVGKSFAQEVFRDTHVLIEVYAEWCSHCKELAPKYEEFALKMQTQNRDLVVAKIDGDKNGIPYEGFDREGYPTIFHIAPGSQKPTKVMARTVEDLELWVNKQKIGKAKQAPQEKPKAQPKADPVDPQKEDILNRFMSQPVPTEQTGHVRTVVFRTFIDEVFRDDKSTILEVYSPTCPHCRALAPQLETFAEGLKTKMPDHVVLKFDHTANDMPFEGFEIKGYPTLFYIPAGAKKPSQSFVGSMVVEQMKNFLAVQL
eukprot:TRINITY_DN62898_c0_g1_i1.p1 TRINITY_DN62898_c0_g1~~TRINITY_DN62898_c0_g1_i1.p1  ORF type:complete len:1131 (-),score=297.84 TRINITY_DN62898_c0_g1_i1:159-3551(-)